VDWVNENPDQPFCTGMKPIADYYVDDRGIRFEGDMNTIVDGIIKGDIYHGKRGGKKRKKIK
jgi:hypothetical protein